MVEPQPSRLNPELSSKALDCFGRLNLNAHSGTNRRKRFLQRFREEQKVRSLTVRVLNLQLNRLTGRDPLCGLLGEQHL